VKTYLFEVQSRQGNWGKFLVGAEGWAGAIAERDPAKLRAELIQVAAVAVQWIQAIDRRMTSSGSADS